MATGGEVITRFLQGVHELFRAVVLEREQADEHLPAPAKAQAIDAASMFQALQSGT